MDIGFLILCDLLGFVAKAVQRTVQRDAARHYPSPPAEQASSPQRGSLSATLGNTGSSIPNSLSTPYIPGGLVGVTPIPVPDSADPPARRGHIRKYEAESDDEGDGENYKKSRVAEEEIAEDDADIEGQDLVPQRGHKRSTDSVDVSGRRDKRARKVSLEQPGAEMDVDGTEAEDGLADITSASSRGKRASAGVKRRQSEAGSTFGGDDSLELELEGEDDGVRARHRKRRTLQKRNFEVATRGQKRDRLASDSDSDVDMHSNDGSEQGNLRKRGKRSSTTASEKSFGNEQDISNDPLCKGRKIGEEWTANGIRYKVGMNGQRLRHALVKKKQPTKFPMPSDSQHPDRGAGVVIWVETWLSEDEYKAAKEQGDLAWQNTPPLKTNGSEPTTPDSAAVSPTKVGKNLLWSSTTGRASDSPLLKHNTLRQSITTTAVLRVNPFQQSQATPNRTLGRRISANSPLTLAADSPKQPGSKTYSKWEKQDLEAEAMAKMRQKLLDQKKNSSSAPTSPSPPLAVSATPAAPNALGSSPVVPLLKPASSTPPFAPAVKSSESATDKAPPQSSTGSSAFGFGFPSVAPKAQGSSAVDSDKIKPPAPLVSGFGLGAPPTSTNLASSSDVAGKQPEVKTANESKTLGNPLGSMGPPPVPVPGLAFGFKPTLPSASPLPTSAPKPADAAAKPNSFTFGPSSTNSDSTKQSSLAATAVSSPSLLSRIGESSSAASGASPAPGATVAPAPSLFSFKPNTQNAPESTKASSFFANSPGANTDPSPVFTSKPPTFSFSLGKQPETKSEANKNPGPSAANPSAPTPSVPSFSFGAPKNDGTTTAPGSTAANKPVFGMATGGQSAFGVNNTGSIFGATNTPGATASKPAPFTFGSASATSSTPAGDGKTAEAFKSAFSNPTASAASPAAPKTTFSSFGSSTTTPAAAATNTAGGADKKPPTFSFNFGSGASTGPNAPAFGSGGALGSSTNPNVFGSSAFATNNAAAPAIGTANTTSNAFSFGQKPAAAGTSSQFGLGATPSSSSSQSPFTFGTSGQNQGQK
ncbi:hypothetical protein PUNSTDRAFT_133018 [Punctularia strigosozonata HHB-11173 SS5]|uniref:uncharacterized protein n=1 Tax=Punctularia strigosozonata (strain HHB-11173) TaxID=741275 RepID=UPI000441725A|nr:uncharacterized protein PUNSTDRAFT_133018 [Punctularia strigosozonata HHB-11173 SS5]EIN10957.1 hypothetical protein PUNSTDRAFT_133018 [Punctularia strigosozonata HHB-11173 SS5]